MAEPLNATFFALQPRDRAVLLPATISIGVIIVAIFAAWVALNWGALNNIFTVWPTLASTQKPDDATAFGAVAAIFALAGSALLFMIPLYIAIAAYEAACLRWMIRGEAPGLFGITLDNDTWRVYGVYWCWFVLQFAINIVFSIVALPIVFMSMGSIGANPTPDQMLQWQLQTQLPITLLQYLPMIFLGVRFAPAAAVSVARKRFSFGEAWTATKEKFWPILGSFALLWGAWLVGWVAVSMPLWLNVWPHLSQMMTSADETAMQAYFNTLASPEAWLWIGLSYGVMLIGGLAVAVLCYGVNARVALVALEEGKIKSAA